MVTLRQTEEIENKIAELLVSKFDISDSLLKEITKKISSLANKKAEDVLKKSKESIPNKGLTRLISDSAKKTPVKKTDIKGSFFYKEIISRLDKLQLSISNLSGKKLDFKLPKIALPKDIFKDFKLPKIPKIALPKDIFKDFKLPKLNLPKDIFKDFKLPKIPKLNLPTSEYSIKDRFKESGLFGLIKDLFKSNKEIKNTDKKEKYSLKDRFNEGGLFGIAKDLFKNFKWPKMPNFKIPNFFEKNKLRGLSSEEKSEEKPKTSSFWKGLIKKISPQKDSNRLTKDEEKPNKVLLEGITENGFKDLVDKMPKILKGVFDKKKENKKDEKKFSEGGLLGLLGPGMLGLLKGALLVGGGIALLLGGLAALISGLQTDGPFKGLLKIFSKVGLFGGLKLIEKGAKTFLKNINALINAPVKLLTVAYKALRGIFSSGISKTITSVVGKAAGLFTKVAAGLLKFITPFLRRIPLVGTAISLGFAYTRFKSGDYVGGAIDILSAIANAFAIVPGFGLIGSGIALGLDVLNAFLDYKAGGSSAEAGKSKMVMIGDFFKGIGKWIYEKSKYLPIIGRLINAGEAFVSKDWAKGFVQLSRLIPGTGWVMDLLGYTEEKQEQAIKGQFKVMEAIGKWIYEKAKDLPVIGRLIKAGEAFVSKDWAKGFVQLSRLIPGTGWVMDLLGYTEEKQEQVIGGQLKVAGDLTAFIKEKIGDKVFGFAGRVWDKTKEWWKNVKNWWKDVNSDFATAGSKIGSKISSVVSWMKDSVWSKVTGFVSKIKDGIVGWWNNVIDWWNSDDGKPTENLEQGETNIVSNLMSWMKKSIWDKVTGFASKIMDTVKNWWGKVVSWWDENEKEKTPELPESEAKEKPKMAKGGVVTQPTEAIIGEAGPEAVVPLDQYMSPEGFKISNDILQKIASNTGNTNDTMKNLSLAILKLAEIFDKKSNTNSSNNIMINGQSQQEQYPSASQIAANNVDPIRIIRSQFAV